MWFSPNQIRPCVLYILILYEYIWTAYSDIRFEQLAVTKWEGCVMRFGIAKGGMEMRTLWVTGFTSNGQLYGWMREGIVITTQDTKKKSADAELILLRYSEWSSSIPINAGTYHFLPTVIPQEKHAHKTIKLTLYRPVMPFGNGKIYFRGSFQFSFVTIKKISPLWKPKIY